MAILNFRSVERRRTTRSSLRIKVVAYGEGPGGEKFKFWTRTTNVAAHGGVIELEHKLPVGQEFQLMNEHSMKRAAARMVGVRQSRDGLILGAFEFVERGDSFWSMVFPAPGARPLRRFTPKPGAARMN